MRIKFYSVSFFAWFLVFAVKSFSQSGTYGNNVMTEKPNTPIDTMINGYIEILPLSYSSNPTKKYPLLIFLEGVGQFGDGSTSTSFGLPLLYGQNEGMLPDIVRKKDMSNNWLFPNSYVVGGITYEFIVIVPQFRRQVQTNRHDHEQMASPDEVNDVINFAFQNYRVDEQRVYLSGLSLGGGSTWNYAGQSTAYANRLAAIVPFSGASNLHDNVYRATNIAASNLPVWTFVNDVDATYRPLAQHYIDTLQTFPAHTTDELITIYTRSVGDHNSWQQPLQGGNTLEGGNTGGTTNPSNIYVWMLGKTRSSATQPVFATVNAGSDQTLNLSNGSMVLSANGISFTGGSVSLSGTITPASGRTYTYTWVQVNGNGGTITSPNSLSTTVTGLKPGLYSYQLIATDNTGLATVDAVNITVNAPPENKYMKVEAEAFTTADPNISLNIAAVDQGPATSVGSFDYYLSSNTPPPNPLPPAKYVEYSSLSLPAGAGLYALYYRYNSSNSSPVIQISVNGTVVATKTLVSTSTWRSDSIHVNLPGTPVTIRFTQSSTTLFNSPWNFNILSWRKSILPFLSSSFILMRSVKMEEWLCNGKLFRKSIPKSLKCKEARME